MLYVSNSNSISLYLTANTSTNTDKHTHLIQERCYVEQYVWYSFQLQKRKTISLKTYG